MTDDERFRRLLRWYPASWRRAHGDVVVGTMREVAVAEGRDRPSHAEARAARVDGLAHRLDRNVAIGSALVAVVLSFIGLAATIFVPAAMGAPLDSALRSIVGPAAVFSTPAFLAVSAIATLRVRGLCARAALWSVACVGLALVLLGLAAASWSVAFDEADAGTPPSLFASAWMLLAALSALATAATGAVLMTAAFASRLSGWAPVIGLAAGLITWPVLAATLPSPGTTAMAAIAMLVLAVQGTRPREDSAPTAGVTPANSAAVPTAGRTTPRRWIAVFAFVSFALGTAAALFALVGSQWFDLDATHAMRLGIGAGALAAIPLIGCLGLARAEHRTLDRWGPPTLFALTAVGLAIVDITSTGDGDAIVWQLLLCAVPAAGGVAWLILVSRRLGGTHAILAIGAGLTTLVLSMGLQAVPFVAPLAALAVASGAMLPARRRRTPGRVATAAPQGPGAPPASVPD